MFFLLELVDTVNVCFDGGCNNISVGSESVIDAAVMLYLHVYLTHVV